MPTIDDRHVKLCGGFVVWDGITSPEQVTQGAQAGKNKYTIKAVFPPTCPDIALFEQLANRTLQESKFRGVLPAGGRMPINQVTPGNYEGQFDGWYEISFKTTLKMPDVYNDADVNGPKLVDAMHLGSFLYTGQKVDVLAHCYEYDSAGNKGISAGLDALNLVVSANAPRLNIGGYNTAAAFGGGAQAAPAASGAVQASPPPQQTAAPGPGAQSAPPQQSTNYLPPEVKYRTPDGSTWTEAQLLASGWQAAAIQALPRA